MKLSLFLQRDINKFDQFQLREFLINVGMEQSTNVYAMKKTAKDFIHGCHSDTLVKIREHIDALL